MLGPFEVAGRVGLAGPQGEAPADEPGARTLQHADVVVEVAAAVEQPLHRDGPGQVVLQHRAGYGSVESVIAGRRGRPPGPRAFRPPARPPTPPTSPGAGPPPRWGSQSTHARCLP